MLIKVYVENIHPEIIEIPDDYAFYINKHSSDFTEEEEVKACNFYSILCEALGVSEETFIDVDFKASRAGVEKKIDTEIKNWFCCIDEWEDFFKTHTIDEAFEEADFDFCSLWDLIQWLRKFCD